MKLENLQTGTKLVLSFGFLILITITIVLVSFSCLNKIEKKTRDYNIVLNAQKDFLMANSFMESYLNERDSVQYLNCSIYLDSAIQSLDVLKPGLEGEDISLVNELFIKLKDYQELMLQNHDAIEVQKNIYGDRRKMRIKFTEITEKSHISRDDNINYYFNVARLNAVYLLSSNDSIYYNEVRKNVQIALKEAKKINNKLIIQALDDYMVSVEHNYDLALKIRNTKQALIILGKEILDKSGKMTNHIDAYQMRVRRSTKVTLLIFSLISIIVSMIISRLIVIYITHKQNIIEQKNNMLTEQAQTMGEINSLLEERQQRIEEQSEELMTQRDQLSELNATKDKLFSILAHDLKNPFNAIIGFSELLYTNIRSYTIDKIKFQVGIIRNSAKDTYDLLDNLLQWSRSQRGVICLKPEALNISECVEKELKSLKQQALHKEIRIDLSISGDKKNVEADPDLLCTVIRNLITNAIKYSYRKSKIMVTLEFKDEAFVFSVKDQGIGMTKDKKDRLFNIKGNESCPGTDGEKGTGLGLLLCADFIEKHKGKIGVESRENVGSAFYFSIPYVQS